MSCVSSIYIYIYASRIIITCSILYDIYVIYVIILTLYVYVDVYAVAGDGFYES